MSGLQKAYLPLKRLIGIVGSFVGIIFCFLLFWWWIFIINCIATKGHPFFSQKRYGKKKKVFKMLKFRTMKYGVDPNIGAPRMSESTHKKVDTWFGGFLRKSSIDETLQLFNILLGDMAFVGPRPGMVVNDELLTKLRDEQNPSPYAVRPGITGYAQIKMKRKHEEAGKAFWDSRYVDEMSLWLDIKIFIYTVFGLFTSIKGS